MRALPVLLGVLCVGCFGQPEDQFSFEGTVHGGDGGVWPGAKVTLERDQGASDKGCSSFGPFTSVFADAHGRWRLDVIRQQTRGRLSEHRCIRASIESDDGRRSYLVFPFTGDDVRAPPLRLWHERTLNGPHATASIFFYTLPDSFRIPEAAAIEYRAEVETPTGRMWRQRCTENSVRRYCDFDFRSALGIRDPVMRASASQHLESYGRDPFGQLKATYFETRVETAPVTISSFEPPLPFSLGAECAYPNAAGVCALTDGDPTPVLFPPFTTSVEVDFGAGVPFPLSMGPFQAGAVHQLYLHGLWVEGAFDHVIVELQLTDTGDWENVTDHPRADPADLGRTQVSRDDPMPGLDLGPFDISTKQQTLTYRRIRIHAVLDGQTIPIKSLGELAVY